MDGLYDFQRVYKRKPETWRDYVYGLGHLSRALAREDLRNHDATTAAGAIEKHRSRWREAKERTAGL